MQLLFEGLEEIAAIGSGPDNKVIPEISSTGKAPAARAPRGPSLPEHLPVREIILNPEAVQACPEELDAHW